VLGEALGLVLGEALGLELGEELGLALGVLLLGEAEGVPLGLALGDTLGEELGEALGLALGESCLGTHWEKSLVRESGAIHSIATFGTQSPARLSKPPEGISNPNTHQPYAIIA